jgi:hypothetical protein
MNFSERVHKLFFSERSQRSVHLCKSKYTSEYSSNLTIMSNIARVVKYVIADIEDARKIPSVVFWPESCEQGEKFMATVWYNEDLIFLFMDLFLF